MMDAEEVFAIREVLALIYPNDNRLEAKVQSYILADARASEIAYYAMRAMNLDADKVDLLPERTREQIKHLQDLDATPY